MSNSTDLYYSRRVKLHLKFAEATLGYQMHAQTDSGHSFLQAFAAGLAEGAIRLCSPWLHSDLVYHNLPIHKKLVAMKNYMWGFLKEVTGFLK